jgi:hypothetical protein
MIAARSMSRPRRAAALALGRQIRSFGPTIVPFRTARWPPPARRCAGALDQERRPAVLQVVLELVGLGQRVDDRHHRVGLEHGPERDDGVDGVIAVDDDAIAALDATLDQDVRQVVGAPIDGAERQAILAPDERDLVAERARRARRSRAAGERPVDVGHEVDPRRTAAGAAAAAA